MTLHTRRYTSQQKLGYQSNCSLVFLMQWIIYDCSIRVTLEESLKVTTLLEILHKQMCATYVYNSRFLECDHTTSSAKTFRYI